MTRTDIALSWARKHRASLLQILLVAVCFLLAFRTVVQGLVHIWYVNEDYSHGFLIVPVSAFLIWSRREALARIRPQPSAWGLPLLALSLLMCIVGSYAEVATLAFLSMPAALASLILLYFGLPAVRAILFPLGFLLFMIPIPTQIYSSLTLPLQLLVSQAGAWSLGVLGVPVYRDGNILHLPASTLQVVQACSGLRSMISLSAMSALFMLTVSGNAARLLVFVAAVPISILVNTFRVTVSGYLSYAFGAGAAEGTAHEMLGISVFVLSLMLLFFWRSLLIKVFGWAKQGR